MDGHCYSRLIVTPAQGISGQEQLAYGDETEYPVSLLGIEQILHQAPENGDDQQVENTNPDIENAGK